MHESEEYHIKLGKIWFKTFLWEWLKKDFKNTRWRFLLRVFWGGLLVCIVSDSVIIGLYVKNHVWFEVAWWQVLYGVMFFICEMYSDSVHFWRKMSGNWRELYTETQLALDKMTEVSKDAVNLLKEIQDKSNGKSNKR